MSAKKVLLALPIVILLGILGFFACFTKVPVASIGVRQARWGGGGISPQDHEIYGPVKENCWPRAPAVLNYCRSPAVDVDCNARQIAGSV